MSQRSSHQHHQINNQPQLTAVCRHSEESCAAARRVVAPRRRVESRPALSAVLAAAAAVADTGEHGRGGAAHLPAAVPRHGDLAQLQLARSWRAGNGKVDASAIYTAARHRSIDDFVERRLVQECGWMTQV